jgi:hypothetical protein
MRLDRPTFAEKNKKKFPSITQFAKTYYPKWLVRRFFLEVLIVCAQCTNNTSRKNVQNIAEWDKHIAEWDKRRLWVCKNNGGSLVWLVWF